MKADMIASLATKLPGRRTGTEHFYEADTNSTVSLVDFWQWAYSDLLSNTNRGRLAEFIVARALGLGLAGVRTEWDAIDLVTSAGVKVEVKSAAYVQSWFQKKPSSITFCVSARTCPWPAGRGRRKTAANSGGKSAVAAPALLRSRSWLAWWESP